MARWGVGVSDKHDPQIGDRLRSSNWRFVKEYLGLDPDMRRPGESGDSLPRDPQSTGRFYNHILRAAPDIPDLGLPAQHHIGAGPVGRQGQRGVVDAEYI